MTNLAVPNPADELQLYAEAFELAPVAFVLIDSQDRIVRVNRMLLEWTGRQRPELTGQSWTQMLLTVAGRVLVETHIRPLLRLQRAARGIAIDLHLADGRRLPVLATIVEYVANSAANGYLLTLVEAIDRQHYERELLDAKYAAEEAAEQLRELANELERRVQERTAELERANRELDSFAHAVSHDLRAPLRAINGFNRMLSDGYAAALDANGRKLLGSIHAAALNMSDLIDGLLQLSLTTRGAMHLEECDLSQMAQMIREEIVTAEMRQVEWYIEPGVIAWADPRMMQAVLGNLLSNAWKYTARTVNARITFDSHLKEGERVFRVADNGAGFEMEHADRLFEPFQRLHSPTEFAGLGLGLATVQRIIARHGGRLTAFSKPNEGATFEFTLPPRSADAS